MKETRIFQIFRAGSHTTMAGNSLNFSENDLRMIAASYNTLNRKDAPLVIGHPEDDQPAYGEVTELLPEGDKLFAVANVDAELIDMVRSGRYKKISSAFRSRTDPHNPAPSNWYLRHVGFLGSSPPAVKNMEPLNFSETGGVLSMVTPSVDVDCFSECKGEGVSAYAIASRVNSFQKTVPSLTYWQAYRLATTHP